MTFSVPSAGMDFRNADSTMNYFKIQWIKLIFFRGEHQYSFASPDNQLFFKWSRDFRNWIVWNFHTVFLQDYPLHGPEELSRYSDYATGWKAQGSNAGRGEIFRRRPERRWGQPSLLYSGYRVFPGGKAARTRRWSPNLSRAEVKESVQLYLYSPPGPLWPVLGWTLP